MGFQGWALPFGNFQACEGFGRKGTHVSPLIHVSVGMHACKHVHMLCMFARRHLSTCAQRGRGRGGVAVKGMNSSDDEDSGHIRSVRGVGSGSGEELSYS